MTIKFWEGVVAFILICWALASAVMIVNFAFENNELKKQLASNDVKIRELKTSCNRHLVVVEDSLGWSIYEFEKK